MAGYARSLSVTTLALGAVGEEDADGRAIASAGGPEQVRCNNFYLVAGRRPTIACGGFWGIGFQGSGRPHPIHMKPSGK